MAPTGVVFPWHLQFVVFQGDYVCRMICCTPEAASGVLTGVIRRKARLCWWHCLSGGYLAGFVMAYVFENLGVGKLFPTNAGVGKAAHMCVVDSMVNWEVICFSGFACNDLLGCGARFTRVAC